MMNWDGLRPLAMLATANTVPWLLGLLLGSRWAIPLDFGCRLRDGQRLFGSHKTWQGFLSGAFATAVAGSLWGLPWWVGLAFGGSAMTGDALSSAIKRRLRRPPGAEMPVIDQLPEALLPQIILAHSLGLNALSMGAITVVFVLLGLVGAVVRQSAHIAIRERADQTKPPQECARISPRQRACR